MHDPDQNASPINHIPTAVVLVAMVLGAVELVLQAGIYGLVGGPDAVGWRLGAVHDYGFFSAVMAWMIETGNFPLRDVLRIITYPFISPSFGSLIFAFVLVLAIGKMVAEVFSQIAFLVIFFASTIIGALGYGLFVNTNVPLIGAYPASYGLIGAFTYILWMKARFEGTNPLRAFVLIGVLLVLQVYLGLVYRGGYGWVAELAGFLAGFLLSFVLAPGAILRLQHWLQIIRRRP